MSHSITIKYKAGHLTRKYLELWNGFTKLTERETDLLEVIVNRLLELRDEGLKAPYLEEYLFNTKSRGIYQEALDITRVNLSILLKQLKDKEVLLYDKPLYRVPEYLVPTKEGVTFSFREENGVQQ